ncbi:hypothetical protein B0O99DRAFT_601807 [Bisporella sp. PMI_857]|nr:hypothetical protein B0O99DRAFT_601807 [Bisporella sp. PMI_857]
MFRQEKQAINTSRTPLSQFDVSDRFSWGENRQTTPEDKTYSLFGNFVSKFHFSSLWREERQGVSRSSSVCCRCIVQFIQQTTAPTGLPETRVGLLQTIYNWADGQDERWIFWLNGLAGTGKSTIVRTVGPGYFDQKCLGASFFSRGGGDVGHAGKLLTSFAARLTCNVPQIQRFISGAVTEENDIANQSLRVDALDECDNENHIRVILQLYQRRPSFSIIAEKGCKIQSY